MILKIFGLIVLMVVVSVIVTLVISFINKGSKSVNIDSDSGDDLRITHGDNLTTLTMLDSANSIKLEGLALTTEYINENKFLTPSDSSKTFCLRTSSATSDDPLTIELPTTLSNDTCEGVKYTVISVQNTDDLIINDVIISQSNDPLSTDKGISGIYRIGGERYSFANRESIRIIGINNNDYLNIRLIYGYDDLPLWHFVGEFSAGISIVLGESSV